MATRCTATNRDGTPCKAWAVRDTDPPRCSSHGGLDHAALTHGAGDLATLDAVIADLAAKYAHLSTYIDANDDTLSPALLARFLALHGQTASRLGRLVRDRQALRAAQGLGPDGDLAAAIDAALDELGDELGVAL
jgi:hypothetical protein